MHTCFVCLCVCTKSSEVKYLTLHNLDEVSELFTNQEKEEEAEEDDGDEELEDEEEDSHFGKVLTEWRE